MYYPPFYQPQQAPQQLPQQSSISNGLIPVPSEIVARNYPVGFGQSVSFRDENLPFLYTKTMGFSQLEPPKFEKYRLVKEETNTPQTEPIKSEVVNSTGDNNQSEIKAIWSEIKGIKNDVKTLRENIKEGV